MESYLNSNKRCSTMKMKTLGWPLRILSYLYLASMPISILGTFLFPGDMFFLAVFGPKSFFYTMMYGLFGGYLGETSSATVWLCLGVAAALFMAILGSSIYAHIKRKYSILFVIAVADVSLYCLLCLLPDWEVSWLVIPNILYSVWLGIDLLKNSDINEQKTKIVEGDI